MNEDEATLTSPEIVESAAQAIAEAFGLGAETQLSNQWPIDDGDSVVVLNVTGDTTGMLLLAVNDDVAERLTSDVYRLNNGFQAALDVLVETLGISLELGEVGTFDAPPKQTIEILDGSQVCALFALHLEPFDANAVAANGSSDDGVDVADIDVPNAESFEPAPLVSNEIALGALNSGPLAMLHEVEMDVTVELGRTTMPIRELLALQPGMVVEIDRTAGTPIDVLVNGHRIACGEVVVIDEEFGVRITEIVPTGTPV